MHKVRYQAGDFLDTEKAKNLTIIFLVLLNLFLAVLVYINSAKFTLTKEQETAIYKVLEQNGISISTKLIKTNKPMREMNVLPYSYDIDEIVYKLFGGWEGVSDVSEFGRTIYTKGDAMLTIEDGVIVFEKPSGNVSGGFFVNSKEDAVKLCDSFVLDDKNIVPQFVLDNVIEEKGNYVVEYRNKFGGSIVFSNYIKLYVDSSGVYGLECSYSEVANFETAKKEICTVDEALYALLKDLKNKGTSAQQKLSIDKIDIVYFQEQISGEEDTALKATPCYRFYFDELGGSKIVDAVTRAVKQ